MQVILLASYPRSGNTLLCTALYHCFGLRSGSVYPIDLGGNQALESLVGHIEHDENGQIRFTPGAIPLIKTHEHPNDDEAAIYVVRDGRAACVSLWEFYTRSLSLKAIITGQHRFGTWSEHLSAWRPWTRPNTLLLKYEDFLNDLPAVLEKLAAFVGAEMVSTTIPARETIADADGRWVRKKSDWRAVMTGGDLELFYRTNGEMMERMGYGDAEPPR